MLSAFLNLLLIIAIIITIMPIHVDDSACDDNHANNLIDAVNSDLKRQHLHEQSSEITDHHLYHDNDANDANNVINDVDNY